MHDNIKKLASFYSDFTQLLGYLGVDLHDQQSTSQRPAGKLGLFGDSILAGVYSSAGIDSSGGVFSLSEVGQTASQLLSKIKQNKSEIQNLSSGLVLIGTNDVGGTASAREIIIKIGDVVEELLKTNPSMKIYLCTIPPFKGWSTFESNFAAIEQKRMAINSAIVKVKSDNISIVPLHASVGEGGIADESGQALGISTRDKLHPDSKALGAYLQGFLGSESSKDSSPGRDQVVEGGTAPEGYSRLKTTTTEVGKKAREILTELQGKPMGSSITFTSAGVSYIGVLEYHYDDRRGKHKGVTVYRKKSDGVAGKIAQLDSRFQPMAKQFLQKCSAEGIELIVGEAYRSMDRQAELYAQGRETEGKIVTNAKPGDSMHNYGLAFDIAPTTDGKVDWNKPPEWWNRIGQIGKEAGMKWGGDFTGLNDKPHFQYPIALADIKSGKFVPEKQ